MALRRLVWCPDRRTRRNSRRKRALHGPSGAGVVRWHRRAKGPRVGRRGRVPARRTKERDRWAGQVGELVVYPGQGVGRLEAIQKREIAGQKLEVLVLRMVEDESRIMIPRDKVEQVGLRGIIGRREATRIWEILATRPRRRRRAGVTWSRQFREYQDKLKSGSVFEIAEVLRDLLRLQRDKELSFGERRVLDAARSLLVQELAAAQNQATESVEAEIKERVR